MPLDLSLVFTHRHVVSIGHALHFPPVFIVVPLFVCLCFFCCSVDSF